MSKIDVSIIYVNYRTSELIRNSILSVKEHTRGINYEIIIVDNATEPDLADIIKKEGEGVSVQYVMLPENLGFGQANNEGFKIARGRNLFCLNPDTLLTGNAIKVMSDYLDIHSNVGAVGGNLVDENMRPAFSFRRILPGIEWELNELFHHIPEQICYGKNLRYNFTDKPIKVQMSSGADLMLKKEVLEKTGGFSNEFFLYYEETDLCARIRKGGYEIVNIPQAVIQHLEGKSFAKQDFNPYRIENSERGRTTYYRLNSNPTYHKICDMIYMLFLKSRAILKKSESYRFRVKINKEIKKEL